MELRFKNALDPHKLQLIIFRITVRRGAGRAGAAPPPVLHGRLDRVPPRPMGPHRLLASLPPVPSLPQSILGGPIIYNEYTIDNTLAVEQSQRAILAMVIAAVVTCAFILLRFGPGFSLSGFLSLASAGLFAICCFAMGSYEVRGPAGPALRGGGRTCSAALHC